MFQINIRVHHTFGADGKPDLLEELLCKLNLNQGAIMSALENLQREVEETKAAAQAGADAIAALKVTVEELREKVAAGEAIEAKLEQLAQELDNAQKVLAGTAGNETGPGTGGGDGGTGGGSTTDPAPGGEGTGTDQNPGNPQA